MNRIFIRVVDLYKRFGDVVALDGVTLDIFSNEILVILGENGSGKSTLAKVLYGVYVPDRGKIIVDGSEARFSSPFDAKKKGFVMISQRPQLIDDLSILENIALFIGESPSGALAKRIESFLKSFDIDIDVYKKVFSISYTEKQFIELTKALLINPRLLIVDEAATYLPQDLKTKFFEILRRFVSDNRTVIYITHKIPEALEIGSRFVVLRRGKVARIFNGAVNPSELRHAMFGTEEYLKLVSRQPLQRESKSSKNVLSVDKLVVLDDYGKIAVNRLSIDVKAGEIVSIVGVAGNGEKELGEAIAGLRKASSGFIKIDGFDVTKSPPSERTRKGLVYVPEDPFKEGTAVTLSIIENMRMYARERLNQDTVLDAIKKLGIVPENPAIQVYKLSGGNIQKVSISRLLLTMPKVVVAHNPTRMLDERSRALVLDILQRFSLSGGGVLLITEDVDEAIQISDKVAVMVDGRIAKLFEGSNLESFRSEIEKAMVHG